MLHRPGAGFGDNLSKNELLTLINECLQDPIKSEQLKAQENLPDPRPQAH
jgi:hypothetical protein